VPTFCFGDTCIQAGVQEAMHSSELLTASVYEPHQHWWIDMGPWDWPSHGTGPVQSGIDMGLVD
jgi:hypothetical protein